MSVLWNSNGTFAEEIPSGYAPLAGLPLQYGLYASIVPGFTYCLLGTTRWIFSERICAKLFSFAGKQPSAPLLSTRSCRSTTPAALLIRSIHKKKIVNKNSFKGGHSRFLLWDHRDPVRHPEPRLPHPVHQSTSCDGFLLSGLHSGAKVVVMLKDYITCWEQVITSQVKGLLGITGIVGRGFVNVWVSSNQTFITMVNIAGSISIITIILLPLVQLALQVGVFSNLTSIQWYDTAVSAFCMVVLYFLRVRHIPLQSFLTLLFARG